MGFRRHVSHLSRWVKNAYLKIQERAVIVSITSQKKCLLFHILHLAESVHLKTLSSLGQAYLLTHSLRRWVCPGDWE